MAEMPNPEAVEEQAPEKKKKGKRSPIALMLMTALFVGPLAVGGFMLWSRQQQTQKKLLAEMANDESLLQEVTFGLEPQTVNLADGDRYARCKVVLSFRLDPIDAAYFQTAADAFTGETKELPEEPERDGPKLPKKEPDKKVQRLVYLLASQTPQLNDALIQTISSRKYEQLLKPADKEQLKKALIKRFDELLTEVEIPVHDIYLSEFVMQ